MKEWGLRILMAGLAAAILFCGTLTAQPRLITSTYLGGAASDSVRRVAVDGSGNIYLAGITRSGDFQTTASAFQRQLQGGFDIFVTKLSPDGKTVLYSTLLGGSGDDEVLGLAVGGDGSVYLTGRTSSADFPQQGPSEPYAGGDFDAFLAKLNPSGSQISFSRLVGGSGTDAGHSIALLVNDRVAVGGATDSADFPAQDAIQGKRGGGTDGFVSVFSSTMGALEFSTYLGGSGRDEVARLKAHPSGDLIVAGDTISTDFPTVDALQETKRAGNDAFVARIDLQDLRLVFSTFFGGNQSDLLSAMTVDSSGAIYIAGDSSSTDLPVRNAFQPVSAGGGDIYVSKLAGDGSEILYASYFGGGGAESVRGIVLDDQGGLYVAGGTNSANLPLVNPMSSSNGGVQGFLAKVSPSGAQLLFSTYVGGNSLDIIDALARSSDGTLIVGGITDSIDFPKVDALQSSFGGRGVFSTTDQGANWVPAANGLPGRDVAAVVAISGRVYACTSSDGLWMSTNNGASWQVIGLEDRAVVSAAANPQDTNVIVAVTTTGVFKTTDGGNNWQQRTEGLENVPASGIRAIKADGNNFNNLFLATSQGPFTSTNAGETWRAISSSLPDSPPAKNVFSIAVEPGNPQNLYIGTQGAVFRSDNGGQTWLETSFKDVGIVRALAISPSNPSVVFASGEFMGGPFPGHYVAKTSDRGNEWRALRVEFSANDPMSSAITSLAVDPANDGTIFVGTASEGVIAGTNFVGNGANISWQKKVNGLASREIRTLNFPPNSNRLFAAAASGEDGFFARVQPINRFYFAEVGNGRSGRIQFQTSLTLTNQGDDAEALVEFFGRDGKPVAFDFGDGPVASLQPVIRKGETFFAKSEGTGQLLDGYARVTAPDSVAGTAVFTRTDLVIQGITLYEAGVPATRALTAFRFLLDSLGDQDTGLAVVNVGDSLGQPEADNEITFTLLDSDRNKISERILAMKNGEHTAMFVRELFPDVAIQAGQMRGSIEVSAQQPVAALTIRQRDNPAKEFPQEVATLVPFPLA
ncbi:MAG TPA: SBBP repeat-containing protein, partial [Acidobacteriota bacterium]|nr:SBBP repeat-containing protein [Acidobacteriota bacterium]